MCFKFTRSARFACATGCFVLGSSYKIDKFRNSLFSRHFRFTSEQLPFFASLPLHVRTAPFFSRHFRFTSEQLPFLASLPLHVRTAPFSRVTSASRQNSSLFSRHFRFTSEQLPFLASLPLHVRTAPFFRVTSASR